MEKSRNADFSPAKWLAVLAAMTYFFLAMYRIDFQSIWYDEGLSLHYASLPLVDGLRELAAQSVHPPLYFLGLHFWLRIAGDSDFALRFPSAAFGTLLVCATFILGQKLADRRLGVIVACLTATSPFLVYYGQEARMYTAVALLSTLSAVASIDIIRRGRGYLILIIASSLAVLTHYFAFLALGSLMIVAAPVFVLQRRFREMANWLGSLAVALAVFLPWATNLFRVATTHDDFWRDRLSFVGMLQDAVLHFSLGEVAWPDNDLAGIFLVAGALGLLGVTRRKLQLAVLVSIGTLISSLLALVAFPKVTYVARYMLVDAPAYFLLVAAGIYNLATAAVGVKRGKEVLQMKEGKRAGALRLAGSVVSSFLAATLVLLIVGANIVSLLHVYFDPASYRREDFKSLAKFVEPLQRPGDAFVFVAGPLNYALFHYLPATDLAAWVDADVRIKPGDPLPEVDHLLAREDIKRVWLVRSLVSADDLVDPDRVSQKKIMERFGVMIVLQDVRGLIVEGYDRELYDDFLKGTKVDITYGGEVRLPRFSLGEQRPVRGGKVAVELFWEPVRDESRLLWVSLQLVDGNRGTMIALADFPAGGLAPTTTWKAGMRLADKAELGIPVDAPAGDYDAYLVLYDPATGERLKVTGGLAGSSADSARLFTIRISD
ncbi:MAG: glycosyltransferase family 39 protein [Dehalococcoidia bacterium]|nr:glycosyltransferase family 39 protein [Dehalococcoidia bacterium]